MKADDYRRDLLARRIQAMAPKKANPSTIIPQGPAVGISGGVVVVVDVEVVVEVEEDVEEEVVVEEEVDVEVEVDVVVIKTVAVS